MSYVIFLDDVRDPPAHMAGCVVARSYEQFNVALLKYGCPEFISFDHDLGPVDVNPSGMDCAKLLIQQVLDGNLTLPPNFNFAVHSMNPVGAENIQRLMENFLKHMQREQGLNYFRSVNDV